MQLPRSILIVTHEYLPYPGGIGRYCASLASAAARIGCSVDVLAPDYGQPAHDDHQSVSVNVHRFEGGVFDIKKMAKYRDEIRKMTGSYSYDVILAADWPAILAIGSLPTPNSVRLATIFGTDVLLFKSLRFRLLRASRALNSFDKFLSISEFSRNLICRHFPALASRTQVVPLGVDEKWFQSAHESAYQAFSERIGLETEDLIVLTVARLDSRKGHDRTLRALALVPESIRCRIKYVCIGLSVDEDYRSHLAELAKSAGIRLVLTGAIPDHELLAAYSMANVFALTANAMKNKVEGFGLVLLEAAAQGLPSVVTPVDAIPEVISTGNTGFIAESSVELAAAFESVLSGDRGSWRDSCITHAKKFSWDACAEGTLGYPS